jgi:hypothetical protein
MICVPTRVGRAFVESSPARADAKGVRAHARVVANSLTGEGGAFGGTRVKTHTVDGIPHRHSHLKRR